MSEPLTSAAMRRKLIEACHKRLFDRAFNEQRVQNTSPEAYEASLQKDAQTLAVLLLADAVADVALILASPTMEVSGREFVP